MKNSTSKIFFQPCKSTYVHRAAVWFKKVSLGYAIIGVCISIMQFGCLSSNYGAAAYNASNFSGAKNGSQTPEEILAEYAGEYEIAGELSNHPKIAGVPISDPAILIGKWQSESETESITLVPRNILAAQTQTPTTNPQEAAVMNLFKNLVSLKYGIKREEFEFRLDGTFAYEVSVTVDTGLDNSRPITNNSKSRGKWSIRDGELMLFTMESSAEKGRNLAPPKNVTQKLFATLLSPQEITIQYASSADLEDYIAKAQEQYKDNFHSRVEYGWDSRGYAVVRYLGSEATRSAMRSQGSFCVIITAISPSTFKKVISSNSPAVSSQKQFSQSFWLESLKWDEMKDFECMFSVIMEGECTLSTFEQIEHEFSEYIRNVYVKMHPTADLKLLSVDVYPELRDNRIVGRASVLTIVLKTLNYDPQTRCGTMTVLFQPGQEEEARAYIKRNIETLARDKNIQLVTGQLPPAATYYSLCENIKGNMMEIEFKTE